LARFLNTGTKFYRKLRHKAIAATGFATSNVTMLANVASFSLTGINTNFGITQSEQDDQTYVITGNSANFNTNTVMAAATSAFTLTGVATNFGVQAGLATGSFTLTGISNNYSIKFALSTGTFLLTGNDVNFLTVSRRRNYGYIFR